MINRGRPFIHPLIRNILFLMMEHFDSKPERGTG